MFHVIRSQNIATKRQQYGKEMGNSDTEDSPIANKPSYTRDTNNVEMLDVIKLNGVFTKELFDKDNGIPIFRPTMPEARFRFLVNCLRFDDKDTRADRREIDKLAAFRDVFERSINKMKRFYVPSEYTIENVHSFKIRQIWD
ncbi:transposase is4 [Holotrichia oblita]|uniref:Transposase is4 n=1 Tax=Holotrichia oblita TaxID=644536 RepID=A0ACB9SRE9_HOLOL|nr:transposase is4 [Holotrichia oblita]